MLCWDKRGRDRAVVECQRNTEGVQRVQKMREAKSIFRRRLEHPGQRHKTRNQSTTNPQQTAGRFSNEPLRVRVYDISDTD